MTFCPGGCAQNTSRIYRWILGDRSTVSFVGAVGADKFGRRLEKLVRGDGVDTRCVTIGRRSLCSVEGREICQDGEREG